MVSRCDTAFCMSEFLSVVLLLRASPATRACPRMSRIARSTDRVEVFQRVFTFGALVFLSERHFMTLARMAGQEFPLRSLFFSSRSLIGYLTWYGPMHLFRPLKSATSLLSPALLFILISK